MIRTAYRLRRDGRGATIIEFALILPVLLSMVLGLSELAYQGLVTSVLTGAMQRAGRNSTIEGNQTGSSTAAIDKMVIDRVQSVARKVTWSSSRKNYAQFGNIAPEPFQDNNNNGKYDVASECFTDLNGNKSWDTDPGATGQGGANDVVVYRMDIRYDRLLPVTKLIGLSPTVDISATTILKNQPYRDQIAFEPTQVCP